MSCIISDSREISQDAVKYASSLQHEDSDSDCLCQCIESTLWPVSLDHILFLHWYI